MAVDPYYSELSLALGRVSIPEFSAGASGYFSKPRRQLDQSIFDGASIRPEVRDYIIGTLFKFWKKHGYRDPESWATVWLAGSGISYQWAGDRGNGDLDCLIGIDWPQFYLSNSAWGQVGVDELTDFIDNELRQRLWPRTVHTEFSGKVFELTYYVNQDATDIRNINPYAAYNLSESSWTVLPSEHTAYEDDPGTPTWRDIAGDDLAKAWKIRATIEETMARLPYAASPQWVNAMSSVAREVGYAIQLMTYIHGNRRDAFRPGGKGYWDFNNWRWQMAKKNGVVAVLGAIEKAAVEARDSTQMRLYEGLMASSDDLVIRAALQHPGAK